MLKFVTDEHVSRSIVTAVRRNYPEIDIVRIQDVGLRTAPDKDILDWAAKAGRLVLSLDVNTMPAEAYRRVESSAPMPGLAIIIRTSPIGPVIEDIALLAHCSLENEWANQVLFIPGY